MTFEQAETIDPPVSLADIADEIYEEIKEPGFSVIAAEREEMRSENPVLVTHVERFHQLIINDPTELGGPEAAAAAMHGYYFGHRVIRTFSGRTGQAIPRLTNLEQIAQGLREVDITEEIVAGLDSAAPAFETKFAHQPDLINRVNALKNPHGRDGVRIIFLIFRDFLTADQQLPDVDSVSGQVPT